MAWTGTSSTVIDLPNGAKVYEGYFDAICGNFDNLAGVASTGLPANVTILGNRTAASNYIQCGQTTSAAAAGVDQGGTGALRYLHTSAFTFPAAFVGIPRMFVNATDSQPAAAVSISNTGCNLTYWDNSTAANQRVIDWLAIGA